VQGAGRIVVADAGSGGGEYRPRVETGLHLHQADAGLFIAGEDGVLNGRGAPPTRQQ
jgi:hypothetical protein